MAKINAMESSLFLKSTIDRPIIRAILKLFSGKCDKDRKTHLEVALEQYVEEGRGQACFLCSHIVSPLLQWVLRKGSTAFGVSEAQLKERFKNPYARRGLASVIRGISKYGAHRPFVPAAPFLIVWDFTYSCNLHCKHCYASAGTAWKDELSTQEALQVVEELADSGVSIIAFSGGEPLLRKDFFQVVAHAHHCGIFTAVATNGTLLTPKLAEKLKAAQIGYVQISLDGATPATHDAFRGIPGVFQKTIQGIKNCHKAGIFVEVATTVTIFNYREVPAIIDLCRTIGVDWFMHYNFIPTGRGDFITDNDLSPENREELLRFLFRENEKGGMQLLSTAPQFARVSLQEASPDDEEFIIPTHFYNPRLGGKLQNLSEFIGGCGAGRFYAALRANGNIDPCVFLPWTVGNIRKDNFEELWDHSDIFKVLRDRSHLEDNCGSCAYKYVCGGCRARAYSYFHRLTAPDPGCIRNIEAYKTFVPQHILKGQRVAKTFG
ncbi:MAG: radical SAM protein [Candidatus Heimdallarchaeota archaeon]